MTAPEIAAPATDSALPSPTPRQDGVRVRVGIAGKGGAGKTATSTMLARALAAHGHQVLALDLDTNPGLAISLDVEPGRGLLPDDAVTEDEAAPYGWSLADGLDAATAVARHAVPTRIEGVSFLGLGDIAAVDNAVVRRRLTAMRHIVDTFDEPGWVTVLDLEAGPTTPFEGYARTAHSVLLLVRATAASIGAAQRLRGIFDYDDVTTHVVVTAVTSDDDVARVTTALGDVHATIPFDPAVEQHEREGSLVDLPAASPAMQAIDALATRLIDQYAQGVSA